MVGSTRISKYRILGKLGSGGMADVFLAVAEGPAGFTKLQVVKTIHGHLAENPEFVKMFLEEARLAALLNHPNVVQTNEVGFESGKAYMVMEYLEGRPLHTALKACQKLGRPFDLELHLRAIAEILAGLHYAHELTDLSGNPMCLVHRDVTPHNVFITFDGGVKLLDFGIAKATVSTAETRDGMVKGKVRYLAPEQIHQATVDRRADIFQVGVMVFEAVTGRHYWDRQLPDVGVLGRLFNGDLPKIDDVQESVDPRLVAICNRALAYDPDDRYATAEQFRMDIEDALSRRGSRSSARDVGAMLAKIFATEHLDMKKRIDEHLRLGSSDTAVTSFSGSFPSFTSSGVVGVSGSGSSSIKILGGGGSGTLQASVAQNRPSPRNTHALLIGGAVLALVGVGLVAASSLRSGSPAQVMGGDSSHFGAASVPPPQPAASEAIPPVASSEPSKVRVTLSFQPRSAHVTLDGITISSNPFVGDFPNSDSPHRVRAEAVGYETRQFDVVLDKNQRIEISLSRSAVRAEPRGKAAPAAATAAPAKTPVAAPPLREDR